MRTLITIAIACALLASENRSAANERLAAANDCPPGVCPPPPYVPQYGPQYGPPYAPPYGPQVSPPIATPPASPAHNIAVDHRPIARIENTTATGRILGSGTLIDVDNSPGSPAGIAATETASRGIIITCAHLFRDGVGSVSVSFPDVPAVQGSVLKIDPASDLAAIAIPAQSIAPVELAAQPPQRGEPVVSCGYGSDGRLFCNRGQVLGYVVTLGGHGRETLELSGAARQGDSGGPVLNERGLLVGVLFGTNGRVVDATYCGRVREFLSGLSARFGGRAGEPSPIANGPQPNNSQLNDPQSNKPGPLEKLPPILRRPRQTKPENAKESADAADNTDENASPLDKAARAAEAAARSWLSAKTAALLISLGVPGGIAGLAAGAAVWFVMRRGKKRLQSQLDTLQQRRQQAPVDSINPADASAVSPQVTAAPTASAPSVVERHHNRYVPYEASSVDRAWSAAHARVTERYPGAVPYLKIVEGVKDQILSGIDEPMFS